MLESERTFEREKENPAQTWQDMFPGAKMLGPRSKVLWADRSVPADRKKKNSKEGISESSPLRETGLDTAKWLR